ncbi:hypothetical protein [Cellulomonas wangsupingiae]|uniref:hypothetical protein n=1 Tax=Cellulomonas wangsupingiae TaxID=2968085 RepID=UPI001D0F26A7|nr:hypothetical protein [Cellulomonas wangsupingiae]MCM0639333.1 hypothetical protein [Cellulomonas wangsupingiae]
MWFFGHHGQQMTVQGDRDLLGAVHRAILAMGVPVVWLNPTTDQLATAYVQAVVDSRTYEVVPTPTDLSACSVGGARDGHADAYPLQLRVTRTYGVTRA